jgi:hypothetical protein
MAIFALWSAPRARSTAFFRSIAEFSGSGYNEGRGRSATAVSAIERMRGATVDDENQPGGELIGPAGWWNPEPGYLNTASYGLPPRPAVEALDSVLADWRVGRTTSEPWERSVTGSRAAFARLAGVPTADVAIGGTVSEQLACRGHRRRHVSGRFQRGAVRFR